MNRIPPIKIKREELPPGEFLCTYCTAKCCRYFALPIDRPEEPRDFDFARWYLLHEAASIFIDDGTWFLLVHTVCRHLQDDNRCGIYETRPKICADYSTDNCEYEDNHVYDGYFELPEQMAEYIDARFHSTADDPGFRSPRPNPFPIMRS